MNTTKSNNANIGVNRKNNNVLNKGNSGPASNNSNNSNNNNSIVNQLNNMLETNDESSNNYIYAILGILALLLVLISVYYYYYYVRGKQTFVPEKKEILTTEHDGQTEMEVSSGDIPMSKYSNEYGISLWFIVNDYKYKYGDEKVLFRKGKKGEGSPEILLDTKNNVLIVRTQLQHDTNRQLAPPSGESFSDVPANNEGIISTEQFASLSNPNEGFQDLPSIETFVSNNSAPPESSMYDESFFNLISGNNVENFADEEDTTATEGALARNMTEFCANLCKLFKLMESKELSKELFTKIDSLFSIVIEVLELSKSTTKKDKLLEEEITNKLKEQSKTFKQGESNKLYVLMQKIVVDSMKLDLKKPETNLVQLKLKVNDNLKVMNCDIKLRGSGAHEIDANLTITILTMLREALYIKIHNFGKQIEKKYPELISRTDEPEVNQDECRVTIPFQKWTNVVVSQYNQVIDIYVDGHLVSSCVLKGFPMVKEEGAVLCPVGGFGGSLSRVSFYNTAITQDEAYEIYRNGGVYSGSWLNSVPTYAYVIVFLLIVGLIAYSMYL